MDAVGAVEETVAAAVLPAPVKAEVEKSFGAGKLLKVKAETDAGKPTIYEAQFEAGGKKSEVKIAADGKVIARE